MRWHQRVVIIALLVLYALVVDGLKGVALAGSLPAYQHIFLIVMENQTYSDIIGNANAPHINDLAQTYGLATQYDGVTHPSEPNYVALIGGSFFGIQNDNSYTTNTVNAPDLGTQLEGAGLTWKAYQQSLPSVGYTGTVYPPVGDAFYVSKHNPFLNFSSIQTSTTELQNIVPDTALTHDLTDNRVPSLAFITPDVCHDMHGGPAACPYGSAALVSTGDTYVYTVTQAITGSTVWTQGNDAIVIVWDEADSTFNTAGCCDATAGGGQVPAIVITNHGPHGFKDSTPYNHYALLRTIQQAFGLGCLQDTCDATNVPTMAALFGGQNLPLPPPTSTPEAPSSLLLGLGLSLIGLALSIRALWRRRTSPQP